MTKKDEAAAKLCDEVDDLQIYLSHSWLDRSLPDDWDGLFAETYVEPKKTRITLRVDTDIVRWFRKLGPGYQTAMNKVLRIYYLALISGQINSHLFDRSKSILRDKASRRITESLHKQMVAAGIDPDAPSKPHRV